MVLVWGIGVSFVSDMVKQLLSIIKNVYDTPIYHHKLSLFTRKVNLSSINILKLSQVPNIPRISFFLASCQKTLVQQKRRDLGFSNGIHKNMISNI
jgi:hypothetical protein